METLTLCLEEVTQKCIISLSDQYQYHHQLIIHENLRRLNRVLRMNNTMGSMNLEEFLKGCWTNETNPNPDPNLNPNPNPSSGIDTGTSVRPTVKSLRHEGSLGISGNFSEKISDEVWGEFQERENVKVSVEGGIKREPSIGEMTLEDFLTKEGAIDECPLMPLDIGVTSHCFSEQLGLSPPPPSVSGMPDTPISGSRRHPSDRGIEKKLNRKIKNRESAARSRARKQAYHNELVSKVSCLEEQNMRLKKEQEMENHFFGELLDQPRFQLRRTSSAVF